MWSRPRCPQTKSSQEQKSQGPVGSKAQQRIRRIHPRIKYNTGMGIAETLNPRLQVVLNTWDLISSWREGPAVGQPWRAEIWSWNRITGKEDRSPRLKRECIDYQSGSLEHGHSRWPLISTETYRGNGREKGSWDWKFRGKHPLVRIITVHRMEKRKNEDTPTLPVP